MRAVVFDGAGGNEVVGFEERPDPTPGTGEVVVAARYAGLNPADLIQRAGNYPAPPGSPADIPGLETAGTVVARGPGANRFQEGDRVFGIVGGGGLADRVAVHERHLTRVPDTLGEQEAAAVPEVFITAHDAIVTQAELGLGDVLLVNGANGGVGLAGVQIGRAAGARVFANVRSENARGPLADLGAEVVTPDDAAERVQAAGGADVVLELVGAPYLELDFQALALKGRIVVVGAGGGGDAQLSLRSLMGRRGRIMGTGLRMRPPEEKAAAVLAFEHQVVPLLADGRARAIVDSVFPAAEATAAFDRLASSGKLGKVLIEFS
jgi:NADPH:quinone reductase-like Zn-dependent oxidoreductase